MKLPRKFSSLKISILEEMVAGMLLKITQHNDNITTSHVTRFHSRQPPAISISSYLKRIIQYTTLEKACLLILLVYIDRISVHNPNFILSSLTIHRFLIAAITVISKLLCDAYCTNSHYARVGGISTQELNTLELEFLFLIDWNLFIDNTSLTNYYLHLVRCTEGMEMSNDGEDVDLNEEVVCHETFVDS